jgi:hypothetical protein
MHKRATWVVVGFIAVVVIAAALDAVFFRSHAPASTRGTTSEASDAPPSRSNQLELRINRDGPPKPPRHENYVTLNHIRGGVCSFSRRQTRIWTFTPDGRGEGGVLEVGPGSDLSGTYGPSLGGQLFRFRFSPSCRQTGPFAARVQAGDYVDSRKIQVYRCGIEPPPFR